jgi:hypothetical protein
MNKQCLIKLTKNKKIDLLPEKNTIQIFPENQEFTGIRFDYKTNLFLAALAIYLLLTTCFSINGSSVGIWNAISEYKTDPQILLGTPHGIRMDEWGIHTPAILSQCNSRVPFFAENYSLGDYKTPLVMNLPVAHFSTFLRPQYWLFFLVGTERAYAFYWNMKSVILVGGVFLLLMLLLENNFFLSLFGALWIYFSSYMQWWYSSPAMWPELVGYFALFTSAIIISLTSRRKTVIVAASLVFLVSFFNFVISLYPPHQVSLVYLSFCIVLGVLLPKWRSVLSEFFINRFRLICICVSLLVTAGLLFAWYLDAKQTLEVLANTVYPGERRIAGGGISIVQIFNGFLGIFMTENNFPEIWTNVCESSNFFLLFPIPLMVMCWKWFVQKKVSALDVALSMFILIIIFWQIFGFPKPVAKFSLFDRVTEIRALLPLGIASIVWTCFSLHQVIEEKTSFTWRFRIFVSAIMLVSILLHSLYFNFVTSNFASVHQIIIVCIFVSLAGFLFISKKPMLFAGLILIPNIYFNGLINPICVGLKPILNNPLYKKINNITRQEPYSKWVVYSRGYPYIALLAQAAGANVFNGLKYVPNLKDMRELSTKNNDIEIYNRYSEISLLPVNGSEISFTLSSLVFHYIISVNPENDCWKRLGITYGILCTDKEIYFLKYKL